MGKQGECSREQARKEILLIAADHKKRKQSEFIKELVENKRKFAKNTIYKYLKELVKDKLMKMEAGSQEDRFSPDYSITKLGLEKVKQNDVQDLVNSLDPKWLNPLRNLLIKVKHENPRLEDFLNSNCITYIGDVPCTFPKSLEGIQSQMGFEASLRKRHNRDLERFREEYIKADAAKSKRVDARIREEVGWTLGEYLKTLLKKAEEEKEFIRKFMIVFGITDEMLEEMNKR